MPRIFVIADSISIHYGPYLESFLRGKFSYNRKGGATANLDSGLGANGGDSRRVLAYLRERIEARDLAADVLVFNCGLHDIKMNPGATECQVALSEYQANLRAIIAEARQYGLSLVWVRTTPIIDEIHNTRQPEFRRFNSDVDRYNATADAVMTEMAVPGIDLHRFTAPFLPEGLIDHAHFSTEVRRLQAAFIAGALEVLLGPAAFPQKEIAAKNSLRPTRTFTTT